MLRKSLRVISFLLVTAFSSQAFSSTGTIEALSTAIDSYEYEMTVNWDQKDEFFYTQKTAAFFEETSLLIANGNITKEEIVSLIKKKTNNKQIIKDLEMVMASMNHDMTPEQMADFLKSNSKHFYQNGANWIDNSAATGVVLVFIIGGLLMIPLTFKGE